MAPTDEADRRQDRLERRRRRVQNEQQTALAITIGGALLVFVIVLIIVLASRSARRRTPSQAAAFDQAESERVRQLVPDEVPTVIRKPLTEEQKADLESQKRRRQHGRLSGKALREQIDKEFQAAKRRAALYEKQGRWGKAIKAFERLGDRFEDQELWLRCQPEVDELLARAGDAFRDAKRTAEERVQARKYLEGRKILLEFADTCEIESYAEECRERAEKLLQERRQYLEQHYAESLAPIEALLPDWKFDEAAAEASKLRFDEAEYQQRLERRLDELRALAALKKKMIRHINMAMPRVQKRALRAPGLVGEFTDASDEGLRAETEQGKEEFTWVEIGPEAAWRLAKRVGDESARDHALAVAHLLIEVGHLKRARRQLEAAKALGADIAPLETRLAQKEAASEGGPE